MIKLFRVITIITITLFLNGCILFKGAELSELAFTNQFVPKGTPIFQQGFKDGCANGLTSRGNILYRTRYGDKFHYDTNLIDNPEYQFGVSRGYSYCFTYYTAGGMQEGFDAYLYAKGTQFDMGKANIDDTVNYEEGHWSNAANVTGGGIDGIFKSAQSPKGFTIFGSHPLYGSSNNQIFSW